MNLSTELESCGAGIASAIDDLQETGKQIDRALAALEFLGHVIDAANESLPAIDTWNAHHTRLHDLIREYDANPSLYR